MKIYRRESLRLTAPQTTS